MQLEALREARHVGDARAEHARLPGELLVDYVGNLVRDGAQLWRRDGVRIAYDLRLLAGVEHTKAHLDLAIAARGDFAKHERLRAAILPIAIIYLGRIGGQRAHRADVLNAEAAAAREVR